MAGSRAQHSGCTWTEDSIFTTLWDKVGSTKSGGIPSRGKRGSVKAGEHGGGGMAAGNPALEAGYPSSRATSAMP